MHNLPLLPGEFYRVLDEPERVKLFAQALVTGVLRPHKAGLGETEWVCGPQDNPAAAVWLTTGNGDLFRALVTFVQDKKDRRDNMAGDLPVNVVKGWIAQAAGDKPLDAWVGECRQRHPEWFAEDVNGERAESPKFHERYARPRQAFIAAVLDYYLADAGPQQ